MTPNLIDSSLDTQSPIKEAGGAGIAWNKVASGGVIDKKPSGVVHVCACESAGRVSTNSDVANVRICMGGRLMEVTDFVRRKAALESEIEEIDGNFYSTDIDIHCLLKVARTSSRSFAFFDLVWVLW